MSVRSRANVAAATSRHIRSLGFRPLPSGTPLHHHGFRVQAWSDTTVCVTFDLGTARQSERLAAEVADAVRAAELYEVEFTAHDRAIFYMNRKETH